MIEQDFEQLSLEVARRVDKTCVDFERDWKAGQQPRIEAFLPQEDEPARSILFHELLFIELEFRKRSGETFSLDTYVQRFPDAADTVREVFQDETISMTGERVPDPDDGPGPASQPAEQIQQERAKATDQASDGSPPSELPTIQLRDYELREEIGRGGVGTVYKAVHTKLGKTVALKVLSDDRMKDSRSVARFEREMKAVGTLEHPNIVRATDAGEADGVHFLVMEFIEGLDLSKLVRLAGPLTEADACELICQAAVGLQHAHEHGLIHRDVKPSNLILSTAGTVKLLDLGLARLHESLHANGGGAGSKDELTATGQIMGTVDYMAPEQATDTHNVDIRADIYSLGCTLYKLLAGRAPFTDSEHSSPYLKMKAHAESPVPPIADERPDVSPELSAVLERLLAKDPADRYATPGEVAQALMPFTVGNDLAALLERARKEESTSTTPDATRRATNSPISSALTDTRESLEGELKETQPATEPPRRRFLTRTTAAAAALLILLGGVIYISTGDGQLELTVNVDDVKVTIDGREPPTVEIKSPRDEILIKIAKVKSGKHVLEVTKDGFTTRTEEFWIFRNGTKELSAKLVPLQPAQEDQKPPELADRWQLGPAENVLPGIIPRPASFPGIKRWQMETAAPRTNVKSVDWSPDGKLIAAACESGQVRVYDADSLELKRILPGNSTRIPRVAWSPDGKALAATGAADDPSHAASGIQNTVNVWNVDGTLRSKMTVPARGTLAAVCWAPDGTRLAASDGLAVTVLSRDGEHLQHFRVGPDIPGGVGTAMDLAWSPDDKWIGAAGHDKIVRLFESDGTPGPVFEGHAAPSDCVAWSPDSKTLASGGNDTTVRLWNVDGTAGPVLKLERQAHDIAWSGDGKYLATASVGTIELWNADGLQQRVIEASAVGVVGANMWSLDWSPDDSRIVVSNDRNTLFIVRRDGTAHAVLKGHWPEDTNGRDVVAFSPEGDHLATAGRFHGTWVWSADGSTGTPLLKPSDLSAAVAWHPDEKRLATTRGNEQVHVFDFTDNAESPEIIECPNPWALRWSPDGRWLAIGRSDGKLNLVHADGTKELELQLDGPVISFDWSADSQSFATCPQIGPARLWQLDGTPGPQLDVENEDEQAVAFSPDGKLIAVGHSMMMSLWRPDGVQVSMLKKDGPNPGSAFDVAWSRDNRRFVSGHWAGTLRLWDIERGQLKMLSGHEGTVISVDWSHDDRRIASYSLDSTVTVWNADTYEPEWTAVLLNEGRAASFTAAGQPMVGDAELIEKEFVHIIETEDGRFDVLKPSESRERIAQTKKPMTKPATIQPAQKPAIQSPPAQHQQPTTDATQGWQPGPADDVTPGIIPRPASFPGIKRWQMETAVPRTEVKSVDWSPDGRLIAAGCQSGRIRIYDATSLEVTQILPGNYSQHPTKVAWSPDGKLLAGVGVHSVVNVWNIDGTLQSQMKVASGHATKAMTRLKG